MSCSNPLYNCIFTGNRTLERTDQPSAAQELAHQAKDAMRGLVGAQRLSDAMAAEKQLVVQSSSIHMNIFSPVPMDNNRFSCVFVIIINFIIVILSSCIHYNSCKILFTWISTVVLTNFIYPKLPSTFPKK